MTIKYWRRVTNSVISDHQSVLYTPPVWIIGHVCLILLSIAVGLTNKKFKKKKKKKDNIISSICLHVSFQVKAKLQTSDDTHNKLKAHKRATILQLITTGSYFSIYFT